eukprot:gene35969-46714_t
MALYENPPQGFRDIDHARNSVNDFLKGLIQVNKGNKISATGRTNSAIFRAIVENEVRGVFGYYLRCSNCKNLGKGCLRLKCTARAVGSYEFDDESIQRINEIYQLNEKCRNINSPIIDHMISSSLFTTDPSSSIATFNFPDEEKEEEAVTIVDDFISYYDRGGLTNSSSSSSPDTTSGSNSNARVDNFSPPSSPILTLDSLVYVATPENSVHGIGNNEGMHNSSAVAISPSDWGSAFAVIGGKRTLEEAAADFEFRSELNNTDIPPAVRSRLLTLWEQHGPQNASIRKPAFSLGKLLAERQKLRAGDKPGLIPETSSTATVAITAAATEEAREVVGKVEAGDLLASDLKNLKIADDASPIAATVEVSD